jgi:antitoxin (DNA-binding transcriptional repressor) of toxin-antitoxin stability system
MERTTYRTSFGAPGSQKEWFGARWKAYCGVRVGVEVLAVFSRFFVKLSRFLASPNLWVGIRRWAFNEVLPSSLLKMPVLSRGLAAWGWSGASADRVAGRSFNHECDTKMYHMKTASLRDLRYSFKKVEYLLRQGEEVQITKRRHVIARLVPEQTPVSPELPDVMGRMRAIYGTKKLKVSGADLVSEDRSRY